MAQATWLNADEVKTPTETHEIGQLSTKDVGQHVVLYGYLGPGRRRDMSKKLSFWNISSRKDSRHVQIVSFKPRSDESNASHSQWLNLSPQSPVAISGTVKAKQLPKKASENVDNWLEHEKVEIDVTDVIPLNVFPPDVEAMDTTNFSPEQRHLEIRKGPLLKKSLEFRAKAASLCRQILEREGFLEVETPMLFKSTPEGAREFLVPTRTKGLAYALPQSPQQYKQILMASGVDRYFQLARCFRDEDLRADRQPEFTQLDLEMGFANEDAVMNIIERIVQGLWADLLGYQIPSRLTRMSYHEAMATYGSDKPDTRLGMEIIQVTCAGSENALDAIVIPSTMDPAFVNEFLASADGVEFSSNTDGKPVIIQHSDSWTKTHAISDQVDHKMVEVHGFIAGTTLILQPRRQHSFTGGSTGLGRLRLALHKAAVERNLVPKPKGFNFLWVVDFPLFSPINDQDPGQGGQAGLSSTHHPFTAPKTAKDVELLETDPLLVKAAHYDLVVNGVELGGGSRRIHVAAVQEYVLREVLKMPDNRIEDFRHLLNVLHDGCPPHAGIALGFDRLIAVMLDRASVRDVIAFPKSGSGEDLLVKSPNALTEAQLATYHLRLK
jgi:aspartyl-tRNA synthetase